VPDLTPLLTLAVGITEGERKPIGNTTWQTNKRKSSRQLQQSNIGHRNQKETSQNSTPHKRYNDKEQVAIPAPMKLCTDARTHLLASTGSTPEQQLANGISLPLSPSISLPLSPSPPLPLPIHIRPSLSPSLSLSLSLELSA